MSLFMPTQIVPDMRSGLGLGVIDAAQDMKVSWRINGASALQSFQITIYLNNAVSTQKYSTGQITTGCPAYGTSNTGEPQIFSYTIPAATLSSNGITNGNEYKMIIKQWWSANDSVTQASASVFFAKETPTLTISAIGSGGVISEQYYTFTGNYAQAQGDVLNWFRWQIAFASDTANPFYDTGNISGTMNVSAYYDGFFTGNSYAVRLTCQTENGVEADTGWVNFSCSYTVTSASGNLTATCATGTDAVLVKWSGFSSPSITGFSLYRRTGSAAKLTHIADVASSVSQIYDYGAINSGATYTYYLFPTGSSYYQAVVSDPISPCWWNWTLMECEETANGSIFSVVQAFRFRLNLESGAMSNNNSPSILQNFTQYPKVQLAPQNYKSGTITGLIGMIDWTSGQPQYVDSIALRDKIFALSLTENPLFLKSRKGDLLKVRVASPIGMQTNDATYEQTQTGSISWVEVGSTDGISLYALQNEGVAP